MGQALATMTGSCVQAGLPDAAALARVRRLQALVAEKPSERHLDGLALLFGVGSGEDWKQKLGFQNVLPLKDVRGGGALSLLNLEFFCGHPRFGPEARATAARRRERGGGANYPFATAGINLTHHLAVHFEVVTRAGTPGVTAHTRAPPWHLLAPPASEEGAAQCGGGAASSTVSQGRPASDPDALWHRFLFEPSVSPEATSSDPAVSAAAAAAVQAAANQVEWFCVIYSLAFLLLDATFTRMGGTYMEFPIVLQAATQRFEVLTNTSKDLVELEKRVRAELQ